MSNTLLDIFCTFLCKKCASTKWECIFKMDPSVSSKENTSLNSNYILGRMFSVSFLVSKNKGEFKFPKPDKQIQTSFTKLQHYRKVECLPCVQMFNFIPTPWGSLLTTMMPSLLWLVWNNSSQCSWVGVAHSDKLNLRA